MGNIFFRPRKLSALYILLPYRENHSVYNSVHHVSSLSYTRETEIYICKGKAFRDALLHLTRIWHLPEIKKEGRQQRRVNKCC